MEKKFKINSINGGGVVKIMLMFNIETFRHSAGTENASLKPCTNRVK